MVEQTSAGGTTGAAGGHDGGRLSGGVIATLVGVGLLLVFMIQNTAPITLRFLFWSWSWPLWLFTLLTALLGALVWFGLGVLRRHRRRADRRAGR
ncbi:lipopolysaccharide assembly protein LapA domain-containing protein [Pseudonocardia sp. RS010]|uniref:lipopolysaccharide assembly protein LapA domain-containing protein n=1 Tax=Pseudonocardia sp. RS010 TaxID=3385979 RepID=UPI00399F1F13